MRFKILSLCCSLSNTITDIKEQPKACLPFIQFPYLDLFMFFSPHLENPFQS